jgi:hypothetical protein
MVVLVFSRDISLLLLLTELSLLREQNVSEWSVGWFVVNRFVRATGRQDRKQTAAKWHRRHILFGCF